MDSPPELSLAEIHKFMIKNNCKVTNHALVKHFKKFLKNPATEHEARKQFKTYVNILATVVNEHNQKYLQLREKYLYECPSEDIVNRISNIPTSPGNLSINSEIFGSPYRQPPPYKPPPQVLQKETQNNYRDCISEFKAAVRHIDPNRMPINDDLVQQLEQSDNFTEISSSSSSAAATQEPPILPPRKSSSVDQVVILSRNNSYEEEENKENVNESDPSILPNVENQMSVKEATRKFNRMASEEEAKVISPQSKKKPEKVLVEDKVDDAPEVTIAHPKAKEWLVSAAKASYHELAKLSLDYPELVRLHDPTTTALHWAAKHGNEDVCKLIAGTYKANINARTNGGYTPLHLAMQFGRENIFELLCNVYKANRDITDWSGNKPLDYSKQRTTVSASTYSKIKARKKHIEKDSGFLRIGSLNVRVKKTTEAFSNFLGVGSGNNNSNNYQQQTGTIIQQQPMTIMRNQTDLTSTINNGIQRSSVPPPLLKNKQFDKMHKTWGSVDNIQKPKDLMPPPSIKNHIGIKKRKSKHNSNDINNIVTGVGYDPTGYSSMPTTPNQIRASPIGVLNEKDSDSDTACGFDSNWTGTGGSSGHSKQKNPPPTYI